jgi:hypothetical protein
VFTLKNPHNIPARRFPLKAESKNRAIYCHFESDPCFGYGHDITVSGSAKTISWTSFGHSDIHDTGLDGDTVLTGRKYFKIEEIEVFEITD